MKGSSRFFRGGILRSRLYLIRSAIRFEIIRLLINLNYAIAKSHPQYINVSIPSFYVRPQSDARKFLF